MRFRLLARFPSISGICRLSLFLILLFSGREIFGQAAPDVTALKKEAAKRYDAEDYSGAYPLYSQLVANFPNENEYSFRLGVCMIYSEADKKKCLEYLKKASKNYEKPPKDFFFFLGKAHHINYLFDEAIKYYNDFKAGAAASLQKKLQVDREIQACENGKRLLSNLSDVAVRSKKQLNEADYFRTYDLRSIGGKLLVKPEEFSTPVDKKRKERSVMFLPKNSDVVYFSSYGSDGSNGKDIFTCSKQADGSYGKPVPVPGINTPYDEDYPFLHPDGKSLYFASKGHNSMGGYDIFKSVYDEGSNSWSAPVNLEFPINSPDDDYLFVTDSLQQTAFFSTGRQSPPGKIDVLKINIARRPIDLFAVSGNVLAEKEGQALNSKIRINLLNSVKVVSEIEADGEGNFVVQIPKGENLLYTVETPGLGTQTQSLSLPLSMAEISGRQEISYVNGKLKINTFGDEGSGEGRYKNYLKVIEEKAKLDVNTDDSQVAVPVAVNTGNPSTQTKPEQTTGPTIIEESLPAANPKKLNNKALSAETKAEAQKAGSESRALGQDARDAYTLADQLNKEANSKLTEAQKSISQASGMEDGAEKSSLIETAGRLQKEAENDKLLASNLLIYGKSLENDATSKQRYADLNSDFSNALGKSKSNTIGNDPVLTDKQSRILSSSGKNQSELFADSIRREIADKEKQIVELSASLSNSESETESMSSEISRLEQELEKARKKSAKENLQNQISDLKTERQDAEKQAEEIRLQKSLAEGELAQLKRQDELFNKVKSESVAPAAESLVLDARTSPAALQEKYKDRIVASNSSDVAALEIANSELKNYNREIDQLIKAKRGESGKTKNARTKQELAREIKQLENTRAGNNQLIAKNEYVAENLKRQAKLDEPVQVVFSPLSLSLNSDLNSQVAAISKQLEFNDAAIFDNEDYASDQARELKAVADRDLNTAEAKQRQVLALGKTISGQSAGKPLSKTPAELEKESDELLNRSMEKRREASTATGAAKTKLLNEAKALEEESRVKLLEAADVVRKDNASLFETNGQNINQLISERKSPPADISKASNLIEEAQIAYKQGEAMRQEAAGYNSSGAKLGNLSNAEEKEAEALAKQKEALDLLLASNPGASLKVASTSENNQAAEGDSLARIARLDTFNSALTDLIEAKNKAYRSLYEANAEEISRLLAVVTSSMMVVEGNPNLKTQWLNADKRHKESEDFRRQAENASDPSVALSALINSTRKQQALMPQLMGLVAALPQAALATQNQNSVVPENQPQQSESPETNTGNNTGSTTPAEPLASTARKLDGAAILNSDTSTGQLLRYFDRPGAGLRNDQALNASRTSIKALQTIQSEQDLLQGNQENNRKLNELLNRTQDPASLRNEGEGLENEAEQLSARAFEKRKEAGTAAPEQRETLVKEAAELEEQAMGARFLAVSINQMAFDIDFKTNEKAISELKQQLSDDNESLDAELDQVNIDIQNLNNQVRKLKEEAASLPNRSAQLGALSNVEEKERELLTKQKELIKGLQKKYPDYTLKPLERDSVIAMIPAPTDPSARLSELQGNQISELTNLTNALTLEYESAKAALPASLSPEQEALKANADELSAQSRQLLLEASNESDPAVKVRKMNQAARLGAAAVEQQAQLLPALAAGNRFKSDDLGALSSIGSNVNGGETEESVGEALKIEGLEVVKGNAYSAAKPIPFEPIREEGLTFRVQIGAFRNKLADNTFKGLSPLNGETTSNGYFRYTAGNFNKIESANAVKNDLRKLGYRDAFVVAYFNGKRITASEAIAMMANSGQQVDLNAPGSAGIRENLNIPRAILTEGEVQLKPEDQVKVTKELSEIEGLLYTIQIGVYTRQASKQSLMNLQPIYTKQLPNGLYRYTAGIYDDSSRVSADRNRVAELGISDAFISAYLNGNSLSFAEARRKQALGENVQMERANPIIFPENNAQAANPVPQNIIPADPSVQPFRNNVQAYPQASPENGIKENEEGISYKVQIGAFSKQVPNEVASKFMQIRSWPVEYKVINGLYVYNVGNFSSTEAAKALKNELVQLGISDAFLVVYRNGNKLYGAEAATLLAK